MAKTKIFLYRMLITLAYITVQIALPVKAQRWAESPFIMVQSSHGTDMMSAPEEGNTTNGSLTESVPEGRPVSAERYALIIGNENYDMGISGVSRVPYAVNDANAFRVYAARVFGVPEENILFRTNATGGVMETMIDRMFRLLNTAQGRIELYFYFSGHGMPCGDGSGNGLMPVDLDPMLLDKRFSLQVILNRFASVEGLRVYAFADACFNGAGRGEMMVTAQRGIRLLPNKQAVPKGVLLFTASDRGAAYPDDKMRHGLFTYQLLNTIRGGNRNQTWGEMSEHVIQQVRYLSVKRGFGEQVPEIIAGANLVASWRRQYVRK